MDKWDDRWSRNKYWEAGYDACYNVYRELCHLIMGECPFLDEDQKWHWKCGWYDAKHEILGD